MSRKNRWLIKSVGHYDDDEFTVRDVYADGIDCSFQDDGASKHGAAKRERKDAMTAGRIHCAGDVPPSRLTRSKIGVVLGARPLSAWTACREVWRYGDLLLLLAKRDLQLRYKQTLLGASWAIIQPLATVGVLSLVMGHLLGLNQKSDGVPYDLFLLTGLIPWTFFANGVSAGGQSLVQHASMLQKVYFPRLILPLSALGAPLSDMLAGSSLLAILMLWHRWPITAGLLLLPIAMASLLMATLGISLLLSAWTVRWRDFRHAIPFLLQVWFFVSPVLVPASALPEKWRWLWALNPVSGTLSAWRSAILGLPVDYASWTLSSLVSLLLLILGANVFTRSERRFADLV